MATIVRALLACLVLAASTAACMVDVEVEEPTGEDTAAVSNTGFGTITVVTDPDAMVHLEKSGYSFAQRFADAKEKNRGDELATTPRYKDLVANVKRDVLAAAAQYPAHGKRLPTFGDESKTARERVGGSSYQELNWTWLTTSALHWELVGVVNRFDRRSVPGRDETCGETRLIYRPAYDGSREDSRLPIGVILVFPQTRAAQGCRAVAESWVRPEGAGASMGEWLQNGPLAGLGKPISFELNALTDLWSRFVREEKGVGRHHQYSLRVFRPSEADPTRLAREPLANTPDVEMIVGGSRYNESKFEYEPSPAKPARKAALLKWIVENRELINTSSASLGPLDVDGEGKVDLRAVQVDSFTAMGPTRAVNRPYSRIFGDDLGAFQKSVGLSSKTAAQALLRKLDMMTCSGCHATRSVVGLHIVGEERDYALYVNWAKYKNSDLIPTDGKGARQPPFLARLVANKMAVGISPHLRDERDRRAADLEAFLKDGSGVAMPPPDRGKTLAGSYGATCYLGDKNDPGFGEADAPEYRCKAGYRCMQLVDNDPFGQCTPRYDGVRSIGDPLEVAHYTVGSSLAAADSFRENGPVVVEKTCKVGRQVWLGARRETGFPFGGICTTNSGVLIQDGADKCRISGDDSTLKIGESGWLHPDGSVRVWRNKTFAGAKRVVCGASPFGNHVAETWGRMSTAAMIWESVAPGLQIACDDNNPCRDEYVCMRTLPDPKNPNPRVGTCMPGYVLAQLEIDAHRVPGTRVPCIEKKGDDGVVQCN